MLFFVIAFLWIVEAAQSLFILYQCVLAIFLILKNCQVSVIFCHCFSLNSGSRSIAVYFVIRWCPGHLCFLHRVFFHWHSLAWFCTRFLQQVFFLWHSPAWFCTTRRPRWLDFEREIKMNLSRNLFFLAMVVMARIRIFCEIVRDSNFLRLS